METCVGTYVASKTGLGAERIRFFSREMMHVDDSEQRNTNTGKVEGSYSLNNYFQVVDAKYILRPETIESLFVLYRVTNDKRYQDLGWMIFQAIQSNCRTPAAYSGIRDVDASFSIEINFDDSMQSFFWAETLKYLFLLFGPTDVLPLDEYVFNTEAHPLKVMPGGITSRIRE